jgi:predicted RNA-binding Zn-ribbon protein involved in translation (DUF1610 family)
MAFFEKVGETISSKTIMVANKAKDIAEVTSLNSQISTCESVIQKNYEILGKAYYELNKNNQEDEYATQCTAIGDALKGIQSLTEQIQKIKGIKICTGCGGEIPGSNIYCPKCGKKVEVPTQKEETVATEKICPTCGCSVGIDAAFCPTCGQKLN